MKRRTIKKLTNELMNSLERAELNYSPGRLVGSGFKITKKVRRHFGRRYPNVHGVNLEEMRELCLEPNQFWNNWVDWRDGMRDRSQYKRLTLSHPDTPRAIPFVNRENEINLKQYLAFKKYIHWHKTRKFRKRKA